MMVYLCHL